MNETTAEHIRNFCIIAHIDHGKSTLADCLIERCGGLSSREMQSQVLDSMDLERERGITIKAQAVRLRYTAQNGQTYQLNLIDTPGHVDFAYEVSRSLAACEGALLVVDAAQGVEAQTLAVCYAAVDHHLEVISVLNKIDLPQSDPKRVIQQIEDMMGIPAHDAISVSAKNHIGIDELLEAMVQRIPPPRCLNQHALQALIIDSWFDVYLGVVVLVRVHDGSMKIGDTIYIQSTQKSYQIQNLGVFTPKSQSISVLKAGEVGFMVANIKEIEAAPVGDTVTLNPQTPALPGFQPMKPMVFAGLFPMHTEDYPHFREALLKLRLNDASLNYEPETSQALGFGFRCGFLGLLHMDIVRERLEREYQLQLIVTAPSVCYEVTLRSGESVVIQNPSHLPDVFEEIREPIVEVSLFLPSEYLGSVMQFCLQRRGIQKKIQYVSERQVSLICDMPMSEMMVDFFDQLKSMSRGYASMDYQYAGLEPADLVKMDILLGGEKVDALACIVHRSQAYVKGRGWVERLQKLIPRQMFDIAIQAAIGNHVIARSTVKALRKNVTAKCYGGDITRKRKLLEKQKEGKKRMKRVGQVDMPQEAFLAFLNADSSD